MLYYLPSPEVDVPSHHSEEFERARRIFTMFVGIICSTNVVEDVFTIAALIVRRAMDCISARFGPGDDSVVFAVSTSLIAALFGVYMYVIMIINFSPFWYLIVFLIPVHVYIRVQIIRFLDFTLQRIDVVKGDNMKVAFYVFQLTLPFILRTAAYVVAFASFFRVWNENQDHMRIWSTENFCNVENDGGRYYCSYEYFTYHTKGLISLIALSVLAFVATIMSLLTIKARNERDALRYNKKENQQQVILSNTNM